MKHVILGVGAAGIAAAKTIRSLRPDDEIVMISTDDQVHSRCMLHKFLAGERDEEGLRFVPADFFEANNIRWRAGVSVSQVNTVAGTVQFDGGEERYDRLLVATGTNCAIPPVPGLDASNVYGLHRLSGAQAIREAAETAENVSVIGGGLIGLDAAYALLELGKKVTVVEMEPRILSQNLDERAAAEYQRLFEERGCSFLLGEQVLEAEVDEESDRATALKLASGKEVPCDLVVVATGVRAAISMLEDSGVACERSVLVDARMSTNVEGVYAAGDVTGLSGIWSSAVKMGEVAARNMCGVEAVYDDTFAVKNTMNFFGLLTLSVGRFAPTDGDHVLVREDRSRYEKLVLRDGKPVGVTLQGEIANSGFWQHLIKNGIDISELDKPVWKVSYADYCAVDERGEYQWASGS